MQLLLQKVECNGIIDMGIKLLTNIGVAVWYSDLYIMSVSGVTTNLNIVTHCRSSQPTNVYIYNGITNGILSTYTLHGGGEGERGTRLVIS